MVRGINTLRGCAGGADTAATSANIPFIEIHPPSSAKWGAATPRVPSSAVVSA